MRTIGLVVVLLCTASACTASSGTSTLPLVKVADVPLGGRATRMDYASYDQGRHLLFIAHLGESSVIVFDTQANRVVARMAGVKDVHGALAIPELGRVYATATGSNEVVAIDESTLKIVARVPTDDYPDGMAYAPEAHKLYVSNEVGAAETVVDVRSNTRKTTIALGGEVGNSQYDPVSRHVFANVQNLAQLVEIDPVTDTVVARIDLPGARGNHGLLIDPQRRLAFIACEDNARLLVLSLTTRRIVASFDVGRGPDVLAIDPEPGWVYVASEAGVVSVFKAQAGNIIRNGEGMLGPNAHVVAVDPISHLSYFPLKDVRGETMLRIMRMHH